MGYVNKKLNVIGVVNFDDKNRKKRKYFHLKKIRNFSTFTPRFKMLINPIDEKGTWHFLVKKNLNPVFNHLGSIKLGDNVLPLSIYRKIFNLYDSILDARKVMLRYRSDLSTVVDLETNCITPLVASNKLPMVFYKREDTTSIKAYKIRGAIYQMSKIIEQNHSKNLRFVAASTGNHALGVLKSAEILKVPRVTICISSVVTPFKQKKLQKRVDDLVAQGIKAELVVEGDTFDKTNTFAKNLVETNPDTYYIDPYDTHNAVGGQGTIGLELIHQLENQFFDYEKLDYDMTKIKALKKLTIIIPIGGGGLISGISTAVKMAIRNSKLKHVSVNIIGVRLKDLNSRHGDAIKVKVLGEHNQDLIKNIVDKIVTITDMDMQRGINFVLDDMKARIEGASAATLKPIFDNIVIPSEEHAIVCLISGGNATLHS
ncbi:MAG: pyridoxal-phosphate dependent enzyme [bacterium]